MDHGSRGGEVGKAAGVAGQHFASSVRRDREGERERGEKQRRSEEEGSFHF